MIPGVNIPVLWAITSSRAALKKEGRLHSPHRMQAKLSLGGLTLHCLRDFLHNLYPDASVLLCYVDSNLLIFSCLACVELQAYFVSRALVHLTLFSTILLPFSTFSEGAKRRLFWGVIPLKPLWNNLTWHVPIQGSTKGSGNTIQ